MSDVPRQQPSCSTCALILNWMFFNTINSTKVDSVKKYVSYSWTLNWVFIRVTETSYYYPLLYLLLLSRLIGYVFLINCHFYFFKLVKVLHNLSWYPVTTAEVPLVGNRFSKSFWECFASVLISVTTQMVSVLRVICWSNCHLLYLCCSAQQKHYA